MLRSTTRSRRPYSDEPQLLQVGQLLPPGSTVKLLDVPAKSAPSRGRVRLVQACGCASSLVGAGSSPGVVVCGEVAFARRRSRQGLRTNLRANRGSAQGAKGGLRGPGVP